MSAVETLIGSYEFNRTRTLGLLDAIEASGEAARALAWRSHPDRAHIGWQLMHIAITEDLFASERLIPGATPRWPDLAARFKGGSTPDDNVPTADELRSTLAESRSRLLATLRQLGDAQLETIPEGLKARGLTLRNVLHLLAWHEAHHQGQAHSTFNLYKALAAKP